MNVTKPGAPVTFVSAARLARFSMPAVQSFITSEMHEWNFRAAGEVLATAGRMEVVLRQSACEQLTRLSESRGSECWPLDLDFDGHESRVIRRALKQTSGIDGSACHSDLVAEYVPLGFWLQLLSNRYHTRLWVPGLKEGFPHLLGSSSSPRETLHGLLGRAVSLRNLAAHLHPLFSLEAPQVLEPFHSVAQAIHPSAAAWISESSQIGEIWLSRPTEQVEEISE
jgi:hypothetical protein